MDTAAALTCVCKLHIIILIISYFYTYADFPILISIPTYTSISFIYLHGTHNLNYLREKRLYNPFI